MDKLFQEKSKKYKRHNKKTQDRMVDLEIFRMSTPEERKQIKRHFFLERTEKAVKRGVRLSGKKERKFRHLNC